MYNTRKVLSFLFLLFCKIHSREPHSPKSKIMEEDCEKIFVQHEQKREELHLILEELKAKGYQIVEPKYKRYPVNMNPKDKYAYLYLFNSMYAFKTFIPNKTFHSKKIIEHNFKIYEDCFALHQWLFGLTLVYGRN